MEVYLQQASSGKNFILQYIEELLPGSQNTQIYKDLFASMDNKAFDDFMKAIESGEKNLAIIAPNLTKPSLDIDRNHRIAEKLGHNFYKRIWIQGSGDTPTYLTPIPYMVVKLPLRRQAQLLVKKISIPADNNSVDDFTGQPVGKSKGSKMSYPETMVLAANNLDYSLNEFLKFRGGDLKGFDAMNKSISRTGGVSLKAIEPYASGVESTRYLKSLLTSMHIASVL